LGRSQGGWTTKIHLACEQGRGPLTVVVTVGHRGDSPQFTVVLDRIQVRRLDNGRLEPGRARTRPQRVLAYSSAAKRACLRRRSQQPIPTKTDKALNRRHRGSRRERPPVFDAARSRTRSSAVSTCSNSIAGWPRDDELHVR